MLRHLHHEPWAMAHHERAWLLLVVSQMRPRLAVEVGGGGSTLLLSKFCRRVVTLEDHPDEWLPDGLGRNVEVVADVSPEALGRVMRAEVDFVLHDGDHSTEAVKASIEAVVAHPPAGERLMVIHDAAEPGCREGVCSVDYRQYPWVDEVDPQALPALPGGWAGFGTVLMRAPGRPAGSR